MTIEELGQSEGFRENWPKIWPRLKLYLIERALSNARANSCKPDEAQGEAGRDKEAANLIEVLGRVALPSPPPQKPPTMPRLSSMNSDRTE